MDYTQSKTAVWSMLHIFSFAQIVSCSLTIRGNCLRQVSVLSAHRRRRFGSPGDDHVDEKVEDGFGVHDVNTANLPQSTRIIANNYVQTGKFVYLHDESILFQKIEPSGI